MIKLSSVIVVVSLISKSLLFGIDLYWPTEDKAFFQGASWETLIQPTVSGRIESGKFGCVRNDGSKFHEGIDIKPKKEIKREAIDKIIAAMDGQVVHINTVAGNSSYGKYIVVVHKNVEPAIYSLYAHLSSIDKAIQVGKWVKKGGDSLGIMGRTTLGKPIPKKGAHLHFEMGVMLFERFAKWYDKQTFDLPNKHGLWKKSAFNLTGFDALDFYEK